MLQFSKTLSVLFLLSMSVSLHAQWSDVGLFNQSINDLKSYSGKLWVGGNFTKVNGTTSYWSAAYNGSTYALHNTLINGTGINRFEVFSSNLFSTGGMNFGSIGVNTWNGSTWELSGSTSGSCTGIFADGNDLYAGSDFGIVFKRTGAGAFTAFPPFGPNDKIAAFAKFNNQIIVGGQFTTINGTTVNNIAAWNGTGWVALDLGLNARVRCLAVYNNALYAGGDFSEAGGQTASYIAKWNGSEWSSVGGSVTVPGFNGIRDMVVANNRLYVVGEFSEIGDVPTKDVASWNGNTWTGMNFSETDDFPNCIEVFNGNIYIGTLSFTASHVYKFAGSVPALEPASETDFACFPNPVVDQLTVTLSGSEDAMLHIYDLFGRPVVQNLRFSGTINYGCGALDAGMYQVMVVDGVGQRVGKWFVKG